MCQLLNGAGDLVTQDVEKAKVLNIISISLLVRLAFRPVGKSEVKKIYPQRVRNI